MTHDSCFSCPSCSEIGLVVKISLFLSFLHEHAFIVLNSLFAPSIIVSHWILGIVLVKVEKDNLVLDFLTNPTFSSIPVETQGRRMIRSTAIDDSTVPKRHVLRIGPPNPTIVLYETVLTNPIGSILVDNQGRVGGNNFGTDQSP